MNSEKSIELLDIAIIETLLKGEKVVIPDLGYLELKTIAERRTVVFKALKPQDMLAQSLVDEKDKQDSAMYNQITFPLLKKQVVSLPQLGIFHPLQNSDGSLRISFVPASSLRKQLNGDNEVSSSIQSAEKLKHAATSSIREDKKSETAIPLPVKRGKDSEGKKTDVGKNITKVDQTIITEDLSDPAFKKSKKNETKWIVVFVILMGLMLFFLFQSKKENLEIIREPQAASSINLPGLAEQHYGNPVFWVYIYEANKNKLSSPINLPKEIELTIPDLSKYKIDVSDSLEIAKARTLSNIILRYRE